MNPMREHVSQTFDSWADHWDDGMKRIDYFAPAWIAKHSHDLDHIPECRVLDLACGTGLNITALCAQREGIHAEGVDLSQKMLTNARMTGRYKRLHTHDLNNPLPSELQPNSFDLVIAFGVVELLAGLWVCLAECHRMLNESGTLWVSFKRFEADDEGSPPRHAISAGLTLRGYSAAEILHVMSNVGLCPIAMEPVNGYITRNGFGCPFYVVRARKAVMI
jgi:predicted TPR repeat methyltransferase